MARIRTYAPQTHIQTAPDALPKKIQRIDSLVRVDFNTTEVFVDTSKALVCTSYGYPTQSSVMDTMETASRRMTKAEVKMFLVQLEKQMMAWAE
jgi:hypothetical protein